MKFLENLRRALFGGPKLIPLPKSYPPTPEPTSPEQARREFEARCRGEWDRSAKVRDADPNTLKRRGEMNQLMGALMVPGYSIPFLMGDWAVAKPLMLRHRFGILEANAHYHLVGTGEDEDRILARECELFLSVLLGLDEHLARGLKVQSEQLREPCGVSFQEDAISALVIAGEQSGMLRDYLQANLLSADFLREKWDRAEEECELCKNYIRTVHTLLSMSGELTAGSIAQLRHQFEVSPDHYFDDAVVLFRMEKRSYVALLRFLESLADPDENSLTEAAWEALYWFGEEEGIGSTNTLFLKCLTLVGENIASQGEKPGPLFAENFPEMEKYLHALTRYFEQTRINSRKNRSGFSDLECSKT